MSDHLPQEIVVKILRLLPMKTLGRCICVCKWWKSLIKNPDFIFAHLNNTFLSPTTPLLLFRYCFDQKKHNSLLLDSPPLDSCKGFNSIAMDCEIRNINLKVIGSCNGLICFAEGLYTYTNTYILWNPLIRKHKTLPEPRVTYGTHGYPDFYAGFGFDSSTNDFKLVRVAQSRWCYSNKFLPQVEVFSLSANAWKDVSCALEPLYQIDGLGTAFVNGIIHFTAFEGVTDYPEWDRRAKTYLIMGFDVRKEVFHPIRLPEYVAHPCLYDECVYNGSAFSLSVYKESSIAVFHTEVYLFKWDVWVMREYGMFESWTKLLSVSEGIAYNVLGIPTEIDEPLGFKKNGDIVMVTFEGELLFLEPNTQEMKYLGITGFHAFVDGLVGSLALLDR